MAEMVQSEGVEAADEGVVAETKPETGRMFKSNFFERFSRVHPATPFVFYIPLLAWVLYRCVERGAPGTLTVAGLVVGGFATWSLTEYLLHRFLFHWGENGTAFGRRVHVLLHGVHHDWPNDKTRLVMPLGASIPIAIIFYAFFRGVIGATWGEPLYVGMGIGYLLYDFTHYSVHHFKQRTRVGKWLRKHHMVHHFADHDGGFGVSSPVWDVVFGTMPHKKQA
jgi:sterol desaturase/sphingolipid hydroxylase (fatty acid hydroxylase superfamily)